MKVLFLSYNGLLEPILTSQALPYLRDLTKEGYEFVLVTYEKKRDLLMAGKVRIRDLKDRLASEKIEWIYLRYHKAPRVLATIFDLLVGVFVTFYLVVSRKIKIVHLRGVTPGTIMIPLSKVLKVKILFDMRGRLAEEMAAGGLWKENGSTFNMVKRAEKHLLQISDAVTVLTKKHFEYNKGLDYFAKRDIPTDVIPCCVDIAKFDYSGQDEDISKLKASLGLKGKFVLLYPGKIGTFYLLDEMLGFFKAIADIIPETVFMVITPDDPAIITERVHKLGIDMDRIKVVHNAPFDDMPRYMRLADAGIFFISAYNKLGSSPIKMGEFLASGVPVIINPGVGDTEEMVRENRVGVVVKNFSENDYLNAVEELCKLKSDGEGLKARCRKTAEDHLSYKDGVNKYAGIYNILAGGAK
ncbi:MAG: glycosyltransferase [Candidatus Omnitrophota bacterium]|jgi:glycosyltransferase involved in cell wall biosynthesis